MASKVKYGDWISWNGVQLPIEWDTAVIVELRSHACIAGRAADMQWQHTGGPNDIVRFRVAENVK